MGTSTEQGLSSPQPSFTARALAPMQRRLLRVSANEQLGAYRVLRVADPDGPVPDPGQFAMLAAAERWGGGEDQRPYLARAFSLARVRDGEAHYLLEDVGPGTRRLCELEVGKRLWALGPLGRGFVAPHEERRALLVGGGVGIAPLAILQDALEHTQQTPLPSGSIARPPITGAAIAGRPQMRAQTAGGHATARSATPVTVLLGFRDSPHAAGAELLSEAKIATDDGSVGHAGLVTDLLTSELEQDRHAVVYACGPAPMLEAVRAICTTLDVPAQLALEAGMACGFGACYGCVVPTRGGGYLRVCVDGPVIDAALLDSVDEHAGAPA